MAPGVLIALEGIDGAGTSTQLPLLANHLRGLGHQVHTTAEPSRGTIGVVLRQALRGDPPMGEATLALLFAADRLDHLRHEVQPQVASGAVVLTDRYLLSSYAYQACRLPLQWVKTINAQARAPDMTLFFRVTAETAAQRRAARGGVVEHFDATARQSQVAQAYEEALGSSDVGPCHVIDAEAPLAEVTHAAQQAVTRWLTQERA